MSKGAAMNYHFGNKNQWRRWLWNRVAERATDKRNGLVLFLAGEGACDIEAAKAKGFSPRNMIAVERNPDVLKALRAKGVLAIDGDLCDVLLSWSPDRPVAAVIGDFCCGLEHRILLSTWETISLNHAFRETVWAFNFMRGRDSSTNWIRSAAPESVGLWCEPKHRGKQFYDGIFFGVAVQLGFYPSSEREMADWWRRWNEVAVPAIQSYKSESTQTFDSLVFASPMQALTTIAPVCECVPRSLDAPLQAQRRRTAAIMAHHARR